MTGDSKGILGRTVSSGAFDVKLGQGICYVGSMVVLAVSFWRLTRLELTEVQFFGGVLLSLCVPLLLVIVGLLLPTALGGGNPRS